MTERCFSDSPGYRDETERFYENPLPFLQHDYTRRNSSWPSHIVMFDSLLPKVEGWLQGKGYVLVSDVSGATISTHESIYSNGSFSIPILLLIQSKEIIFCCIVAL
jgi:hypothetical protein